MKMDLEVTEFVWNRILECTDCPSLSFGISRNKVGPPEGGPILL